MDFLEEIKKQVKEAAEELISVAKAEEGDILVVGCSSSEIAGERIGTTSSAETGEAVFEALSEAVTGKGLFIAAQCCEHLNRAIVIEKQIAREKGFKRVNVIPQLKAGGSFATAAYKKMKDPWVVESLHPEGAVMGMDIGNTLIGMHLKEVVVPVRLGVSRIGEAALVCARTRPKYVGGERAVYNEELG